VETTRRSAITPPAKAGLVATLATLALLALDAAAAGAAPSASISASFSPLRLGTPSSVSLGFRISAPGGIPPPLTEVDFSYPTSLNLIRSGLGVATCQPQELEQDGPAGCPANSRMGSGAAHTRFHLGEETVDETATLGVVAGPPQDGFVQMLVSATGLSPVAARVVMTMLLVPGRLRFGVPLVPSLPEGEDVAVVAAQVTLGRGLTYYERVRGRTIAYRPRGIELPHRCPRGGFRFAATLTFVDGSRAWAHTVVPCPRRGP
jgi:hypothetical protein